MFALGLLLLAEERRVGEQGHADHLLLWCCYIHIEIRLYCYYYYYYYDYYYYY